MIESAYETLRVSRQAGPEEVRRAFVRLVRRYPPEHFPEKFSQIHDAYRQLSLDDASITDIINKVSIMKTPVELAGFLWGDRRELKFTGEAVELEDLEPLLSARPKTAELDQILETIDVSTIKWRRGPQ
ncbi:MAG: J domain-containing protein [Candidatus Adiutrix sp.]|jgi:hypothetical protein|nr:J domain-containing protein [Candidatus Adiutrix sp.]